MASHVVGIDIVEVPRIRRVLERWGERFLKRIYTTQEIAYCQGRAPQLASRFAAKEAVMKALGTGIRGVGWREVEVLRQRGRAPALQLHGRAQSRARALGITELALSLTHSDHYALASVVGAVEETRRP